MIDTHQAVQALTASGIQEHQARAIVHFVVDEQQHRDMARTQKILRISNIVFWMFCGAGMFGLVLILLEVFAK